MAYIGKQPGTGVRNRLLYTATSGQTTFTTSDSSQALSYSDGLYVDVYKNGVLLDPANDYTATSGTSIVLGSGASADDVIEVIVYDVFSVFDGTVNGDLTVTEDLTVDTSTLKVDSTNNRVGVGTASPDTILDVSGSGVPFEVDSTNSNTYKVQFKNNGTVTAYFGTAADSFFFANSSVTQLARIDSDGIKFGTDSAAANGLGDYEEGTWTPVYQALTSNPTVTHSVQIGRYVKIGAFVNVMFRIQTNATSGGSGALVVGGLPFATTNVSSLFASGPVGFSSAFTNVHPQTLLVGANSQQIQLITNSGTDGRNALATSVTTSDLTNGSSKNDLIGSISYRTDA